MPKGPSNVVMRYEVVCPDTGNCDNIRPPEVRWLNPYSVLVKLTKFGDVYCSKQTAIDNVNISYSETPLRESLQDAFMAPQALCQ